MRVSPGRRVFKVVNFLIMLSLCSSIILPFLHILAVSLSDHTAILNREVGLFPKGFYLGAYREIIQSATFLRSFVNSVLVTIAYTVAAITVCVMAAYPLSRTFYGKAVVNYYFVVTMYFSGGLIPIYLLVSRFLGMFNTYLALIVPSLVSVFYIIIIRSQIEQIPASLTEAAVIDGAGQGQVLLHVVIPCLRPTLAAVCMFFMVSKWNYWFDVLIYTSTRKLWSLQYYLRSVVFTKEMSRGLEDTFAVSTALTAENFTMAAIIIIALPVIGIYPFIQKYFVKGIFAGSVKG